MAEVIEVDLRARSEKLQQELGRVAKRIEDLKALAKDVPLGDGKKDPLTPQIKAARAEAASLRETLRNTKIQEKLLGDTGKLSSGLRDSAGEALDLKSILSTAAGFSLAGIAAGAVSSLKTALKESFDAARDFQKTIAEINSILPRNAKLTDDSVQSLRDLGLLYATDAQSQARAYYQAVSAGAEDAAQATEILSASNAAALATQSDLSAVARVLTSTLNAYAGTGLDAATATDILVKSVDDGAVEFAELTNQLARVTPTAAALKVPLDEAVGSIAFLTRVGFTTEQATTSLASALSSIVKPTEEARRTFQDLGGSLKGVQLNSDTIAKTGGLVEFLRKVTQEAKGSTDILTRIFGDERATKAVLAITNNLKDYEQVLRNVADSSGAAERAGKELSSTFDFQAKKLSSTVSDISTSIGSAFLPVATAATLAIRDILGGVSTEERNQGRVAVLTGRIKDLNEELAKPRGGFFDDSDEIILNKINLLTAERIKLTGDAANADVVAAQKSSRAIKEVKDILAGFNTSISGVTAPLLPDVAKTTKKPEQATAAFSATSQELDARRALSAELLALQNQYILDSNLLDTNQAVLEKERFGVKSAEDLAALNDFVLAKNQLELQAELDKNALLRDPEQKRLADKKAFQQKEIKDLRANADLKRNLLQQEIANQQAFFGAATSLATSKNRELAAIGKAAAIVQATIAGKNAVVQSYEFGASLAGPALGATFAGIAAAATTAQIAQIAGVKGFAGGGVIGSFQGATSGPDNSVATVRTGEMVLNGEQQRNLFNMINSGGMSGDIVIKINEREIARAVRNQKQMGFAV